MIQVRQIRSTPASLTALYRFRPPCRLNPHYLAPTSRNSSNESLPRIAQPYFWQSMAPKFLRRSEYPPAVKLQRSKEWNPATFFIIIFLFIGSNAIQMIALRTDFRNFSRKADAKIGLLQDAIERLQRGESVDVEKLLGSGVEQNEREWEDVLREIENEDRLWQKTRHRAKKPLNEKEKDTDQNKHGDSEVPGSNTKTDDGDSLATRKQLKGSATPGFY